MSVNELIKFNGCNEFRSRIALSVLSGKPVKISNIRANSENPGVGNHELSLLRLIEQITNGTEAKVSETGTVVLMRPGLLTGGSFEFNCSTDRGIGYYLEPLLWLAPFGKKSLTIKLNGVTHNNADPSVDAILLSVLPVVRRFLGIRGDDLKLTIVSRGFHPEGGGSVELHCPCMTKLHAVQLEQSGKIGRIRGVAFACRVSPQLCNRSLLAAKSQLTHLIPDVLITSDHCSGDRAGSSPGFGITLVAETRNGCRIVAEQISRATGAAEVSVPEILGETAASLLCEEIYKGGTVDSLSQPTALLLMSLCDRDVSRLLCPSLSPHSVRLLRLLQTFFGVVFRLQCVQPNGDNADGLGADKVLCVCIAAAYTNLSKSVR